MSEQEQTTPALKPALNPETVQRLQASVRQLGKELSRLVADGLEPLADALTVAYGPQRAARLEREATEADNTDDSVRLHTEAAQASAAVSLAWRRLEQRKREAAAERRKAGE